MDSIDLLSEAEQLFEYTRGLRRDFHRHPELGFQEVRTAGIVARELAALGLEVSSGIAETGVIALVEGEQPGPVALLRFDMDALPIQEQNQVEYASEKAGVMHACGHDGHTAIGLTVARLLSAQRAGLHGTAKLVFQPAEEGLGGAKRMVDEGVLENPRPDLSLSLHLWNERPLGWLGISDGPTMAAAEIFKLRLTGRGGHGAVPNLAIDPVAAAAQVISALQSVVARNVSPLDAAVISVTTVQAGGAFNVIPSEAVLQGTIRTFKPEVRKRVLERFEQVVGGVAGAMECQAEIELKGITPAVVNDARIAARVQAAAERLFPESPVATGFSTMGSEDMAFMMQDIPGCYFFLGSANPERGLDYAHHHPRFDFDERVLPRAAALMAAAAMEFLS
ncbi:MAG: amidohydrolase [Anaerolineales bacterium]|jgi:amidohydrolase|nr:amidohydrolase [Anaerolineales bacterium]